MRPLSLPPMSTSEVNHDFLNNRCKSERSLERVSKLRRYAHDGGENDLHFSSQKRFYAQHGPQNGEK